MSSCACSARVLELFVKELAGVNIRRSRPRSFPREKRHFSTRPQLRQVEIASATKLDDGFIPFDFDITKPNPAIAATKPKQPTRQRRKVSEAKTEELGDEWHAEIEIAAPWPQETSSVRTADRDTSRDESSHSAQTISEAGSGLKPDSANSSTDAPLLHAAEPAECATSIATIQRSRVENRQGRKLRRLQAGTYRKEAETRLQEKAAEVQVSSVLDNIEAMEGPDIERAESRKARALGQKSTDSKTATKVKMSAPNARLSKRTGDAKTSPAIRKATKFGKVTSSQLQPRVKKEDWKIQKYALKDKFGEQGWQPRKRLSPDTLDGIRALHASDSNAYTTELLANHFKVTPEAIRRVLKSKWRPSADESEDRRKRWEKRGELKWKAMAEQGTRPPAKWRAKGIRTPQTEKKRVERRGSDRYEQRQAAPARARHSLAERLL